jgi:peptidoglycan/LPS O-acetylase OafA/YrhL
MSQSSSSFAYHPSLDGVRALAVTAVVLFHGGVPGLGGGFLGVDAFFVLSGFLITSLLLGEYRSTGVIALGAFWGRRVRRLLPALLVMLVVVCAAAGRLLPPVENALLRGDALSAIGYVANWRMIYRGAGYFAATAAPSPLQHAWSLGIEEQFYLLWPLIVIGVLRWLGVRWLIALCVVGTVASATTAWLLYRPDDVNRAYFGTDTRAQALLIGCALAIVVTRLPARMLGPLALCGASATGWWWSHASGADSWLYHGGFTVVALCVAAVLAHAVRCGNRLLSLPPLVWLGRISYGVYLWHWPVFQLLSADLTGLAGPALLALRCGITLGLAVASYFVVELPVRLAGPGLVKFAPAAVAACVVAVVLSTAPASVPSSSPVAAVAVPSIAVARTAPSTVSSAAPRPVGPPRIEILGDSVAWTLGEYLPPHPGVVVYNHATQGCGITVQMDILTTGTPHKLYPYCPSWPSKWQGVVNADHPDVVAILLNRWELMDAKVDGAYQHVGEPAFDSYLLGQLDEAVRIAGSGGAKVAMLTAAYTKRSEKPDGGLYPEDQPARVDAWNALLRKEAAARPSTVSVVDLGRVVCPNGIFTWSVDGVRIRSDGLHFTPGGVQQVIAPWLLPRLVAAMTAPSR